MSTWRNADHDPCPLTGTPPGLHQCHDCRFFRGGSKGQVGTSWMINCNWPRDGMFLSTDAALLTPETSTVPNAFANAFTDEPTA